MHAKISPGDFVFRGWTPRGRQQFRIQREILVVNGYVLVHIDERLDGDILYIYKHDRRKRAITLNLMN